MKPSKIDKRPMYVQVPAITRPSRSPWSPTLGCLFIFLGLSATACDDGNSAAGAGSGDTESAADEDTNPDAETAADSDDDEELDEESTESSETEAQQEADDDDDDDGDDTDESTETGESTETEESTETGDESTDTGETSEGAETGTADETDGETNGEDTTEETGTDPVCPNLTGVWAVEACGDFTGGTCNFAHEMLTCDYGGTCNDPRNTKFSGTTNLDGSFTLKAGPTRCEGTVSEDGMSFEAPCSHEGRVVCTLRARRTSR